MLDIFWRANEKVPSSASMLSNHTHQKKKMQKPHGPSGWEGLFPSSLLFPVGYQEAQCRGGKEHKVFPLQNYNFCEFLCFSTTCCSWSLGALVSSSSLTSSLKTKSFTLWGWINCVAAGTALGRQKLGSERTEAVHSTSIKSQHKIYYNSLYSSLTQPSANSYTISPVHFFQQYIWQMRMVLLPIAETAQYFPVTLFSVTYFSLKL